MQYKILLFIPMYNCEKQITRVLGQIDKEIAPFLSEVIVVNNRSTDNGEQAVIDYISSNDMPVPVKLLRNDENYGLGGSHKVAFQYAMDNGMDYVICLHGDDQGNIRDMIPYIKDGSFKDYDCVLGGRFCKNSSLIGYSRFRIFGNRVFNVLFSLGSGKRVHDLGAGLNMYRVDTLRSEYYLKFRDNLTFNCYMLLYEVYKKQKMVFVPITWREEDQVSNVKMVSQSKTTLKLLLDFIFKKNFFVEGEHRDKIVDAYTAQIVCNSAKYREDSI
ncbi:MAG: glycosyltransferase family 2 protein [Pseudobutyrivibrio sp.]|nr:glycosyltransferase family 2 protein [Pseudobutyrivibrio sp.]